MSDPCQKCGVGFILPSGVCDHCDQPVTWSRIAALERELGMHKADCESLVTSVKSLQAQLAAAKEEIERLRKDKSEWREFHTMQLAAISTASIQNTEASKCDRIERDNPYASTAYFDVCSAIDREMKLRASLAELRKVAEALADRLDYTMSRNDEESQKAMAAFVAWKERNP